MLNLLFIETVDAWSLQVTLVNFLIGIGALCALRYVHGLLSGVNTRDELSKKDNFAFGIVLAGSSFSLALILSSAVSGDEADHLLNEGINILVYAAIGIVLLKVGGIINDNIIFHRFSIKEQIDKQNIAAGIVQAANVVALGIIIQSAIRWVSYDDWRGLLPVVIIFFCGQVLLLLVTRLRGAIYSRRNDGAILQHAFEGGNVALAVRYMGHLLGASLAISTTSGMSMHVEELLMQSIVSWMLIAIIMVLLLSILSAIARVIVLQGIDVVEEVDRQHNIGVAAIEASLFVAVGLMLNGVLL